MSKFTQQHYVAIAGVLRRKRLMYTNLGLVKQTDVVMDVTGDISQLFSEDNPKFSSEKFKKAVG